MARSNWNGFGHVGISGGDWPNGRNERPMLNLRQTEAERLHEQALSFYIRGNLAQAKLLLEKAIILEPSNELFQDTRNRFAQASLWLSSHGHPQHGPGCSHPDAQPQWKQFARNPAPPVSPLGQHGGGEGLHAGPGVSNGNPHKARSARAQWQPAANGSSPQHFSNTVADSMFGPAYWGHPEGVQNRGESSHFGEPQPSQRPNYASAGRTNIGPHYGKGASAHAQHASAQDSVWGQWNDTGADLDPKPEAEWADSGYQQSDVPWTDEPGRAASLPNCNRSGANGSVGQTSLRGSLANSTERFSLKEQRARARPSSPHTWRSEETSSETTNYGLDNFDEVSNKVQEWLVRNESSGVQKPPPPSFGKPKKNKKKKKKKTEAAPKLDSQGPAPQTKRDTPQSKQNQPSPKKEQLPTGGCSQHPIRTMSATVESSRQKDETKSPPISTPCHIQPSKPRTVPSTTKSPTSRNSDKLPKDRSHNPNTGCYPFFDPKRIFDSSSLPKDSGCSSQRDSSAKANSRRSNGTEDGISSRKLSDTTGEKQKESTDAKIAPRIDGSAPQGTEAESLAEEGDRSWLNSSGSASSDVPGRMTREEWEDIIRRMYVPLGYPSNISEGNPEPADGNSSEEETKASARHTPVGQMCNENSAAAADLDVFIKGSPVSEMETVPNSGVSRWNREPLARRAASAEQDHQCPRQAEYVDVRSSLYGGNREQGIPVCHAASGITRTPPNDNRTRFFGRDTCLPVQSIRSTQVIQSCPKPLSKGPGASTQRGNSSPELGSNLPAKPAPEPTAEASEAPSEKSSNVTARGLHVGSPKGTGEGSTEPSKEPKMEVFSAASPKPSDAANGRKGVKAKHREAAHVEGNEGEAPFCPGKDRGLSTRSNQSSQPFANSPTPVSKGPSTSTKRSKTSTDLGSNLPAKPAPEPTAEASEAPSEKSSNVTARGLHVGSPKGTGEGSTEPSKEPKMEVSSAASPKTSNAANGRIGAKAKQPEAPNVRGSEQQSPAKVQPTKPCKPFWEPSRIFASPPKKDPDIKKMQSGAGRHRSEPNTNLGNVTSCVQPTASLKQNATRPGKEYVSKARDINPSSSGGMDHQPITGTKTSTSAKRASASKSECKSPALKSSDSLNSASIGQTGGTPRESSSKYSYVPWWDQTAEKTKDAASQSPLGRAQASQTGGVSNAESTKVQAGAQPAPKSAARPVPLSAPQSRSKDPGGLGSDAASPKAPSENGPAREACENTQPRYFPSGNLPQSTPDAASTRPRDNANSRDDPVKNSPREEFSNSRKNPSNQVPSSKPDVRARDFGKPPPAESKTRPTPGTVPSSRHRQQKRAQTNTANASHPGRPSTNSGSKSSRSGTAQGSRQQTSGRTPGPRTATSAREEALGPRQRQREGATSDNLDVEDVDPWYKWTRAIGQGLWWVLCFVVFLLLILLACLYSTLKVGLKYSWHILRELAKLIQENRHGQRSSEGSFGGQGSWGSPGYDSRRAPAESTRSIDIPTSGGEAIKRLMRCNHDNPYEVLGVGSEASEEDVKKYYRRQCMLVHPDKNDHPNAQEAFQILQKAYETLTDPVKRREFETGSQYAHFNDQMEDFVKKMEEVLNTLTCDVCNGKHRRYETDRHPDCARYCRVHCARHPAYEGDVWVETSHLGFKWHFYAMMEDKIFDITEWARCQDMRDMEANSCDVRYRVGTKRNRNPSRQRTASPNHHSHHRGHDFNGDMNEELLKEFLRQFHQGDPRQGGGASGGSYGGGDGGYQDWGRKSKKHRKRKR